MRSFSVSVSAIFAVFSTFFWTGCVFDKSGLSPRADGSVPADRPLTDGPFLVDSVVEPDGPVTCLNVEPEWWDFAWTRRRPIEMGAVPAHYTVSVKISGQIYSDMIHSLRPDWHDLRIVKHDGQWHDLDRLVEENNESLTVRFKVEEELTAGADPTYFLYYINPDASEPSEQASNVYIYHDDFGGNLDDYEQIDDTSTPSGNWAVKEGFLAQSGCGDFTGLVIPSLATSLDVGFELSYGWLSSSFCADSGPLFLVDSSGGNGYFVMRSDYEVRLYSYDLAHEPVLPPIYQFHTSRADNDHHRHILRVHGSNVVFCEDKEAFSFSLPQQMGQGTTVGLATNCGRDFEFDDLVVRLYVDPEPVPSLGPELQCDQQL